MDTITWIDFKRHFLHFFCPLAMRDTYKWQLLHISKGDRSVDDYTREFLRFSRHVMDVMKDERRVVDLYITGLRPIYIGIHMEGRTLESVIDEVRQLER